MMDHNGYNTNEESQFSDDSEDEDTTTLRRAARMRDTFLGSTSKEEKELYHVARGESLNFGSNSIQGRYLNMGSSIS